MKLASLGRRVQMLKPVLQAPQAAHGWSKGTLAPKRLTGRAGVAERDRIKRRDRYTCRGCGQITTELEIDHIIPLHEGGTDDDSNKQSLCIPCHVKKTKAELARAAAR